jgi:ketosteroid isomerase-like protein
MNNTFSPRIKGLLLGLTLLFVLLSTVQAQLPGKVGSLLSADRSTSRLSEVEGPHAALLSVTDKNSIFFAPRQVSGLQYLKNRPNIPDIMKWEPRFAAVSKSMEWGFTTGTVHFQKIGAVKRQGEYLTVWKRDQKGVWKIKLRGVADHHGYKEAPPLTLMEPDTSKYLRHRSKVRLQQRADIISSNDILFATVLKSDNPTGYKEFLADNARFIFPWHEPILGKKNIQQFLQKEKIEIQTQFVGVDRAYSGEIAYSFGTAVVKKGNSTLNCHYIRIWELQEDFQWKVLIEFFSEY